MKHLIFFMFLFNSCSHDEANDDKLSLNKTPYNGNELRIDGYYFKFDNNETEKKTNPTFFYNSGIFLSFGCNYDSDIIECINEIVLKGWNHKSGWGLFKIEGNNLYIENWYSKPFGGIHKVFSHECEILNDTTYVVKKQYRLVNGQQTEVTYPNQTYHFVEFANKPSSENSFIP